LIAHQAKHDDSIVAVRARKNANDPFGAVSGKSTLQYLDTLLVKAQLYDAILDKDYFLKRIAVCEQNLSKNRYQLPLL